MKYGTVWDRDVNAVYNIRACYMATKACESRPLYLTKNGELTVAPTGKYRRSTMNS